MDEDIHNIIMFVFVVIVVGTFYLIIVGNPVGYAFLICIFAIIVISKKMESQE